VDAGRGAARSRHVARAGDHAAGESRRLVAHRSAHGRLAGARLRPGRAFHLRAARVPVGADAGRYGHGGRVARVRPPRAGGARARGAARSDADVRPGDRRRARVPRARHAAAARRLRRFHRLLRLHLAAGARRGAPVVVARAARRSAGRFPASGQAEWRRCVPSARPARSVAPARAAPCRGHRARVVRDHADAPVACHRESAHGAAGVAAPLGAGCVGLHRRDGARAAHAGQPVPHGGTAARRRCGAARPASPPAERPLRDTGACRRAVCLRVPEGGLRPA
jgi:hypothetical protein